MTDEEREKQRKRRELLAGLLLLLMANVQGDVNGLIGRLGAGQIDTTQFSSGMAALLAPAHANAAMLGRQLAGVNLPFGISDQSFGQSVAASQLPYLQSFVEAIQAGRYHLSGRLDAPSVEERAQLYVNRLVGTANEAWALSLAPDTLVWWDDLDDARECNDCHRLARESPYPAGAMPAYPTDGSTACLTNCRCRLYTEDGREAFQL